MSASPPQSVIRLINEGNLLTTVLSVFLGGLYTMVYFTTVHTYCTRKTAHRPTIILTMTLLYAFYIFNTGCMCYFLDWQFIKNGDSPLSSYRALYSLPSGLETSMTISSRLSAFLADALMIWRCFQLWDRSWRVVAVSIFLWILEIAAGVTSEALFLSFGTIESQTQATANNALLTACTFLIVATSATTTILIAYRIISSAKGIENRGRFKFILDVIVQSSAVYAAVYLMEGVVSLPVLSLNPNLRATAVNIYLNPFAVAVPGLATTVMIARIGRLPQDATFPTTTSVQVSNLQFVTNNSPGQSAGSILIDNFREQGLRETNSEGQEVPEKNMV